MSTAMWRVLCLLLCCACARARGPEGSVAGDCTDNGDNDGDGRYDCEDDGCAAAKNCVALAKNAREYEEEKARAVQRAIPAQPAEPAASPEENIAFHVEDLLVQRGQNGFDVDWSTANGYCEKLALLDKVGWRLPTDKEAVKIVESGKLAGDGSYVMWTSTKRAKDQAVIVGISGAVNELATRYKGQCRARCVFSVAQK